MFEILYWKQVKILTRGFLFIGNSYNNHIQIRPKYPDTIVLESIKLWMWERVQDRPKRVPEVEGSGMRVLSSIYHVVSGADPSYIPPFPHKPILSSEPWCLYLMVIVKCVDILVLHFFNAVRWLEQINQPISLHTCAHISELPTNGGAMIWAEIIPWIFPDFPVIISTHPYIHLHSLEDMLVHTQRIFSFSK